MQFEVRWILESGERGHDAFGTQTEAIDEALQVRGVAMVAEEPAGSATLVQHGRVLEGEEATQAALLFGVPEGDDER